MQIDELNWAILTRLQQNARYSFAEIGREIGLSSPAVAERVKKMERTTFISLMKNLLKKFIMEIF